MQHLLLVFLAIHWAHPVELATGGGERGPWEQNNSRYDFVDDPSVAIMANGDAGVVWVDQARKDVFWQIVAPDGTKRLAAPIDISRTPGEFSWLPRIALSPRDPSHVYILWQEIVFSGGPHGGEISDRLPTGSGGSFPSLAVAGAHVVITWENTPPGKDAAHGIGIAYSADHGTHFTQPALIEGTSDPGPNGGFEGRLTRKLAVKGDTVVVVNSAKRPQVSSRVWMVRGTLER